MKISIFNRKLLKNYACIISAICGIESFVIIFRDIPEKYKSFAALLNIILFVLILLGCLIYANSQSVKCIKINGVKVVVKFGDLFEEPGLKVISFNEYYDTLVDDKVISSNTLNGKYINERVQDIQFLDNAIVEDLRCKSRILEQNVSREYGKKIKYKLGTCFRHEDYILLALSKFSISNDAYLLLEDYLFCLSSFWQELNYVYNGQDIAMPLLGSGITRISSGSKISKQAFLNILVDTFKYSNLSFDHRIKITIVLPVDLKEEISLYELESD